MKLKHPAPRWLGLTLCLLLVITAAIPAQAAPLPTTPQSAPASGTAGDKPPQHPQTTLPPIPAGLPNVFGLGLGNFDAGWMTGSTVPWSYRYQYLSAGVNTGQGWATWNAPPGQFAVDYINTSRSANLIPVFIYYQILQSTPGLDEFTNLNNPATMRAYFDDFKLLMQKCALAGGPVFVNIEPDLTGVMQQHATNTQDDANLQPAAVALSTHPDVTGYPNTFRGVYQALAHLRDLYAPNASLGIDVSNWGARDDVVIALRNDANYDWAAHATRTATYLNSLGPGFQLLFYSPLDRDAAYYQITQSSNLWWDDTNTHQPKFDSMMQWMSAIIMQTNKRVLLWQVPNGNRVYRSENNTTGHYQDNRAEYFLNPTNGRAHVSQWANAGFLGLMWGAGAGSQSHYADSQNDGITNPAPINGNTATATFPDDDGGYLRLNAAPYYQQGAVPLPAAGCMISFSDVPAGAYFYEPVRYLFCAGAVSGYADNTFRPYTTSTRAQLAKMVVLAAGFPINTAGGPHFADVATSDPFYPYVETAANRNLIAGYQCGAPGEPCPGTYFRPGANITRSQIAKIVVNAKGWTLANPGVAAFHDVPLGSPFFAFVETAVAHNVLTGYQCGAPGEPCPGAYFRPGNAATRGQIAKMVYNTVTAP